MANKNTISVQLTVKDDGSVVMKQFAKNSEDALNKVSAAAPKASTGLEKIKSSYLELTAKAATAYIAVTKTMAYMDEGAKALQQESSFRIMAESYGRNADAMIASMKRATRETIDDSAMMQKAVKMMTLGFDPAQIERFSNVVITASQIAGTTSAEAYDRLADAISSRMPRALIQMGAVTKEQMKVVTEAINNGAESTILFELAIANLELRQKQLQGTQDAASVSMQRFHAQLNETGETLGKILLISLQKTYAYFQWVGAAALRVSANIWTAIGAFDNLTSHMPGTDKAAWQNSAKVALANAADDFKASADLFKKANENWTGYADVGSKSSASSIAKSKKNVEGIMKNMEAFNASPKGQADAIKIAYTNSYEETMRMREKFEDFMTEENLVSMNKYQRMQAEIVAIEKRKNQEIEKLLDAGVIDFDEAMSAWEIIARNTAAELKKVVGTPEEGWGAGIKEWMEENVKPAFWQMKELANTTATSMQRGFSDLFFDAAKGKCKDFYSYWESFSDAILRKLTDNLASMVTQWILGIDQMKSATGGSGGLSGGILGSLFSGSENGTSLIDDIGDWVSGIFDADYGLFSGMGFAKGNVFSYGNLVPFAAGGVVSRPTIFPMATGAGLMGEAGPEAIMPLTRNGRGELGVRAADSGQYSADTKANVTYNINCIDSKSLEDFVRRNAGVFHANITDGLRKRKLQDAWRPLLK